MPMEASLSLLSAESFMLKPERIIIQLKMFMRKVKLYRDDIIYHCPHIPLLRLNGKGEEREQ